ncbi:MAG: hypothetical protein IJX63_06190 [Lachnospiraceae bacterium]|nr:hypothetical protein [Lachnospiraceae bacterium]
MKKHKVTACILALTTLLSITGCGGEVDMSSTGVTTNSTPTSAPTATPAPEKSLYEHGLDMIDMMDEMIRSDFYLDTMSSSQEIEEQASELAQGDYTSPEAVYELSVPEFATLLALLDEEMTGLENLSPKLQAQLNTKSASAFITQLNAMEGATAIATSSIFMASKLFVNHEITENTIYLYTFEKGHSVAIVYTIGENNAVSATGYFLMNEAISTRSATELQSSLKDASFLFTVTELDIN